MKGTSFSHTFEMTFTPPKMTIDTMMTMASPMPQAGTPAEVFADAAALKAVGLGAPAPEAFAASLREAGFTLGRDLYDERTLAADIAAQLAGTPVASAPDAAVGFAALRAADAVIEGGGDDA